MRDKLTALLAWAIETQRTAPTQSYRDYYAGYVQAIKDALSMLDYSEFTEKGEKHEM